MTSVQRDDLSRRHGSALAPFFRSLGWPRGAKARVISCGAMIAILLTSLAAAPGLPGLFGGALGLLMIGVAWADSRRFVVPDPLSGSAFALGILYAGATSPDFVVADALLALSRAGFAASLFYLIRVAYRLVRRREGLGLGDVKLAAAAGAWLSLTTLPIAIEIAAVSALAVYLWRQAMRQRAPRATARLPFGAFFAVSIWFAWLLETRLAVLD